MKLNQKGYMLVEIIISFAIAMTIAFFLINLTIKFKNEEQDIYYSSKYISDKLAITKNIMNDLEENAIIEIGPCNGNCINFTVVTEEGKEELRRLEILDNETTGKKIKYGKIENGVYETNDVSYFSKTIDKSLQLDPNSIVINTPPPKNENNSTQGNDYFTIEIPFYSLYSDEDYSIKLFAKISEESATIMYHLNYPLYENESENKIWNDLSGHANGELQGGTSIEEDYIAFDGISGWINTGALDLGGKNEFTIEATVKIKEHRDNALQFIVGNIQVGGIGIRINKNETVQACVSPCVSACVYIKEEGKYRCEPETSKNSTEEIIAGEDAEFYQMATTYDGNELKIYINNKEQKYSAPGSIGLPTEGTILAIGADPDANGSVAGSFLNGEISFVKVSNKALSKNELGKKEIDFDSTLRYYTLDEKDLIIKTDVKKINEKYGEMPTPTRVGYDFEGWFKEPNGGEKVETGTSIQTKGVQVLYAQWKKAT